MKMNKYTENGALQAVPQQFGGIIYVIQGGQEEREDDEEDERSLYSQ